MMNRRCRTVVPKMTGYRVENRHPLLLRTNRQRHLLQGSLGYQRPCSDDGSIGRCPCLASCCPWSLAHWSAGLGGEGGERGVLAPIEVGTCARAPCLGGWRTPGSRADPHHPGWVACAASRAAVLGGTGDDPGVGFFAARPVCGLGCRGLDQGDPATISCGAFAPPWRSCPWLLVRPADRRAAASGSRPMTGYRALACAGSRKARSSRAAHAAS